MNATATNTARIGVLNAARIRETTLFAEGQGYERPVFLEGTGAFAEGEIIGGFVAELGTVTVDGRVLRRWVLQPGKTLRRN